MRQKTQTPPVSRTDNSGKFRQPFDRKHREGKREKGKGRKTEEGGKREEPRGKKKKRLTVSVSCFSLFTFHLITSNAKAMSRLAGIRPDPLPLQTLKLPAMILGFPQLLQGEGLNFLNASHHPLVVFHQLPGYIWRHIIKASLAHTLIIQLKDFTPFSIRSGLTRFARQLF